MIAGVSYLFMSESTWSFAITISRWCKTCGRTESCWMAFIQMSLWVQDVVTDGNIKEPTGPLVRRSSSFHGEVNRSDISTWKITATIVEEVVEQNERCFFLSLLPFLIKKTRVFPLWYGTIVISSVLYLKSPLVFMHQSFLSNFNFGIHFYQLW